MDRQKIGPLDLGVTPMRKKAIKSGFQDRRGREAMAPGDVLAAALAAVARGWSVIPVRPRDKRPLIAWQDHQQRRADAGQVRAWYAKWPKANLGIVTGAVSGIFVVDVDPKHGGAESLGELERRLGPLPVTVEAVSGGGGRHVYFAHPGGVVPNRAGLAPGIDVRGDGGMIVAPPSVHPSGVRYVWKSGHAPDELALAPLPDRLLTIVATGTHPGRGLPYWRRLAVEGVPEGERNTTLASFAGHLLWHGVDPEVAAELLLCWNRERCRPPLPDEEVVRTVESIARLHRRETPPGAKA
ncbi:MAG TPA: bifunctional DNA primase/polymerase [Nitrospiria bacterium]|nr:bifunctional DNA primase/polymerase [Nitrospiria bacterium]